jgi:hypothetical protein
MSLLKNQKHSPCEKKQKHNNGGGSGIRAAVATLLEVEAEFRKMNQQQNDETVIIDWDDGHRPGANSQGTKVS